VNLPGFNPLPDAAAAAQANGYDPGGADTLVVTPIDDNELQVTLTTKVDTFFLGVLGFNQFTVTREAKARYVKPVPLGSPNRCFGRSPSTPDCGGAEDFWAAVSGRRTLIEDGDPYSTECVRNAPGIVCNGSNSEYSRGPGGYPGYYYGVEVSSGSTNLSVEIWDGGFSQRSIDTQTGDSRFGVDGGSNSGPDVHTRYRLYPPDVTPLIPDDHLSGGPICNETRTPGGGINSWNQLCSTIANPTPGIWLVHVESTNNSAGSNNYSIRANASGVPPRVYGINDMSIWSNDLTGGSELFLAEIVEDHAGKKLELQFYDPGDARGSIPSWYRVLTPFGVVPNCSWTVWNYNQTVERQNDGVYNELWIKAIIDLPNDPADMCDGANCYWKMDLDLSRPTERTVWRARVIGNPVRLLP
jgi:hypothetical protein